MEPKYFKNFKTEFVIINDACYKVESVSDEGIMKAAPLDQKGCPLSYTNSKEFDLNKMASYEVAVIGPQPGWSCG